jgi:indolepyruvate ferredoxin oxidoreductase beta subunit
MNTTASSSKRISLAILAMGGEGGGVLADWLVDLLGTNHFGARCGPAHRGHGLLP